MNRTNIEYLDFTWNPLVGCFGHGCAVSTKCWAKGQAKRRKNVCDECYTFRPHSHFERICQPLNVKKPSRIGVCFSADFWDNAFPWSDQDTVLNAAKTANWHWFLNLTKQPQNIPKDLGFPQNWIQGVSVNREVELWRIAQLQKTLAPFKVISFEPIYDNLAGYDINLEGIDWIIIGGQTRPTLLPKPEWISNILEFAEDAHIPVFMKDNLAPNDRLKEIPLALNCVDKSEGDK